MPLFASLIVLLVQWALWVLNVAMFVRAILSWIPDSEEWAFTRFVAVLTEPLVIPVRALFNKMGWFQDMPVDISFLVTYILLSIITAIVEML